MEASWAIDKNINLVLPKYPEPRPQVQFPILPYMPFFDRIKVRPGMWGSEMPVDFGGELNWFNKRSEIISIFAFTTYFILCYDPPALPHFK